MKQRVMAGMLVGAAAVMSAAGIGWTAEHGGTATAPASKEHGGKEHGGQAVSTAEPSAEQIRQAIRDHITKTVQDKGAFTIQDPVTGKARTLTLVRVHDRVGKTGNYYYSCTDMRDAASGQLLDLDFDVDAKNGKLAVVDTRIHKVDGNARYTYDDKDNRIPVR